MCLFYIDHHCGEMCNEEKSDYIREVPMVGRFKKNSVRG